jgi:hypothetical protein
MRKMIIIGFVFSLVLSSCMNRDVDLINLEKDTDIYYVTIPEEDKDLKVVMLTNDEIDLRECYVSDDETVTVLLGDDTVSFYTTSIE